MKRRSSIGHSLSQSFALAGHKNAHRDPHFRRKLQSGNKRQGEMSPKTGAQSIRLLHVVNNIELHTALFGPLNILYEGILTNNQTGYNLMRLNIISLLMKTCAGTIQHSYLLVIKMWSRCGT